jgi:DNA adenine methylase
LASSTAARFNLTRLAPPLEDVHERLAGVIIENLDWHAFIDCYDRPVNSLSLAARDRS